MTCSIEDCDKKVHVRGWCSKHYQRWLNHGDPEINKALRGTRHRCGNERCCGAAHRLASQLFNATHPDKALASSRRWKELNPGAYKEHNAKYRAVSRLAQPKWLSKSDKKLLKLIYEERDRLTTETGVKHEVDHIQPLRTGISCGLHVPWNLQIIPATENNRKPRKPSSELLLKLQHTQFWVPQQRPHSG